MEFVPVDKKIVAENLKALRKKGFKSREAFCAVLGMPVSRYAEYEQGRVSLPYEVAWIVADILECPMDDVGGREWVAAGGDEAAAGPTPPTSHPQGDEERAGRAGSRVDDGTLVLAERIAKLPGSERKAIQDFVSFQENQVKEQGRDPGEASERASRIAAS